MNGMTFKAKAGLTAFVVFFTELFNYISPAGGLNRKIYIHQKKGGKNHESLPERPAQLAGHGVRHRHGQHRAKLQRSQLSVGEALHGHARVW